MQNKFIKFITRHKILTILLIIIVATILYVLLYRFTYTNKCKEYIKDSFPSFTLSSISYQSFMPGMDSDTERGCNLTIYKTDKPQIKFAFFYQNGSSSMYKDLNFGYTVGRLYAKNYSHEYDFSEDTRDELALLVLNQGSIIQHFDQLIGIDEVRGYETSSWYYYAMVADLDNNPSRSRKDYFVIGNNLYYLDNETWLPVARMVDYDSFEFM